MSSELPLTIDLLFGETALSSELNKTKQKRGPSQFLIRVRMLSETFILRPLPWNDRTDYEKICFSNQEYLKSCLNFMSALPDLKTVPIIELGSGDGLTSMFLKRRGFKGVVTSDFENTDSMFGLTWNNEENGLYHKHIPFNWGQRFPGQELISLWKQLVQLEIPENDDYNPFIPMFSKTCIILANDVLDNRAYHTVFKDTIEQLFSLIQSKCGAVPLLLLGIAIHNMDQYQTKFLTSLESSGFNIDPLGKGHNMFLVTVKTPSTE